MAETSFHTGSNVGEAVGANDAELRRRSRRVVPGGMYGHLNVAALPAGYPQFYSRGTGCRVTDVDGKEFIDFMCSWGPIVLGHRHPVVEQAVAAVAEDGICLNGPSEVFLELAEALVDQVAHADWVMLEKNGTDATDLGVRIARAATGRSKVLMARGSYHGIGPWALPPASPGVTEAERSNTIYFEYNDISSLDSAIAHSEGDVAAVVVTPIRHDVHRDLEAATPEFATGVRGRCDEIGAKLMIDDIRCGFRLDLAGSWECLGVRPDLTAYSKAMANGHPLAALLGSEGLREAAGQVTATGSFWMAAPPMAAALATIRTLREERGIETMEHAGRRLQDGLASQAASHGISVNVSGPPQIPFMSFTADEDEERAFRWAGECAKRGVILHPFHNWFINAAHDEESVEEALLRTDDAFSVVRAEFGAD